MSNEPKSEFAVGRLCPCADPENCTEDVPGYRCRKRSLSQVHQQDAAKALALLLAEVEAAGLGDANDYGWPTALKAARGVLGLPHPRREIEVVVVDRNERPATVHSSEEADRA